MYTPRPFAVDQPELVLELMRRVGYGHLVTASCTGDSAIGLSSTALPFVVDDAVTTVSAHLARANPHWKTMDGCEALLIVPVTDAYVSPGWYPSKAEDGKVVPTWNYELVHLHGTIELHEDPAWLLSHVNELTDQSEQPVVGNSRKQWKVSDAPSEFIEKMLNGIVGVELKVERIEAKRKLSQNRSDADQAGVSRGMEVSRSSGSLGVAASMSRGDSM